MYVRNLHITKNLMSEYHIRLGPMDANTPLTGHIPYKHARRWQSPNEALVPVPNLDIFMTQGAFVRACAHAGSDLRNEVGGWMIGQWRSDKVNQKNFIVIEKIMPAPHTKHGRAYLTFTQDSQVALHAELETRYPGKKVVGWYHTHPRMGIFLSQYDTWLHANFFPNLWQVALVIEPHSATGGFFLRGVDGHLDTRQYFGFYELLNNKQRSVVHWRNLLPLEELHDGESNR
ncbi:MAG: Mov34/MPN/PAD-1 family protein [Chloroflexi bacterium]|nr:Mov34/MPN/PAD-1 family protein [Chloroflexota bacterium]